MKKWLTTDYLLYGSADQVDVYHLLQEHRIMEILEPYTPVLIGTLPISIHIPGSDLDIACEVHDFTAFERLVREHFGYYDEFDLVRRTADGIERIKVNFRCGKWPVEIFGQPIASVSQNGFRHMEIEDCLLRKYGESFRKEVISLKQRGMKTEPAFALLLQLDGDPYEQLLRIDCD
ncbi:hypothetical protein BBG47_03425 [Paenibacillus sp. KS1]|uniref:DUF4269 domain-containing protein n=1 Tax=Paenibacillus sp. KS1 TaxID=1849249 RepID=UPI000806633A|nr:DUF4269 domain-containing protein [Paenibacillus sp. KS1]OBY80898.1 hypothetical protein BBG47_03425 [Paenibacillus sp. KS1]